MVGNNVSPCGDRLLQKHCGFQTIRLSHLVEVVQRSHKVLGLVRWSQTEAACEEMMLNGVYGTPVR